MESKKLCTAADYAAEVSPDPDAAQFRKQRFHQARQGNAAKPALVNRLKNDPKLKDFLHNAGFAPLDPGEAAWCADWGIQVAAELESFPGDVDAELRRRLIAGQACDDDNVGTDVIGG